MKKALSYLINKLFKEELETLYGNGTSVEVNEVIYSTNKRIYVINCKLYIGDVKLYEEIWESGLNFVLEECWKYMGFHNKKFLLHITFELT
jgi:hypothetical protein